MPGKGRSRTAATEESEQEEPPNVDEEASEVAAAKEELAEKETERAEDTVLLAQGIRPLHNKLQNRHQQPNIYRSLARVKGDKGKGVCYIFQETGSCSRANCRFAHSG